ncbi:hypothetical protein BC941DRAFT_449507 [Chlamydoabsidia padenii]|nr:hypothetical protein BC941DRAFT_449507 [Chlamydoabsidia padenii]
MVHDDIQGYYENIIDEVLSIHSEDVLVQMAHSMNDQQSLEHLLQPQAIALLHHPVQETCLSRMPGMIAHHLHRLHTTLLDTIEPTLYTLIQTQPIEITNQQDTLHHLAQLNNAMDQQVMRVLNQERLEHKVAMDLSVCDIQQNQVLATTFTHRRSLWSVLKNLWKQAASSRRPGRMIAEDARVTDLDHLNAVIQDDTLFAPSLLQSYLDTVMSSLHMEFNDRLIDLYTVLKTDIFDDEMAI